MVNPDTVDHRKFPPKGSQVEVCSDEEGFRGAWFVATVLEVPPKSTSKKRKRALIQYNTLLAEDGSTPLTELVDPDFVRPPPPQNAGSELGFEVSDVVDAKYRDGWWTGVVTKLLDKSRVRVYFEIPPDVIDFDMKDLRLHWKWVDGEWVQAEKQQLAGSVFSSGTAVEVNLDKDNFRDVWFPAIVIKEIDKNSFFVKCNPSRNYNNSGTEKFVVDFQHIRPPPPRYVDRDYELLEKVDAFCNCGWRAGVVTKLLSGRRYNIFFKHGNETKELSCTDIRPHDEWIDGKWITKSKEILIDSANGQEQLDKVSEGSQDTALVTHLENSGAVEEKAEKKTQYSTNASNDLMEQSTATHDTSLSPSSKEMELTTPNTGRSRLSKKLHKTNITDALSANTISKSKCKPNEEPSKESLSTPVTGATEAKFSEKNIKSNQTIARTERTLSTMKAQTASNVCQHHPSNWKTKRRKVGHVGSQIIDVVKRSVRARKPTSKSSLDLKTGRGENGNEPEQINGDKMAAKGVELPIILGLKAKVTRNSRAKTPSEAHAKESLKLSGGRVNNGNSSAGSKSMETEQLGHGVQVQRRKRGRPRKLIVASPKELNAGNEQPGEKLADDEMVEKVCRAVTQAAVLQTHDEMELIGSQSATADRNDVGEDICKTKEGELAIVGISSNISDEDRPLSTWFVDIRPQITEEPKLASRVIVTGISEKQRQVDIEVEDCAILAKGETPLDASQILPFEKRSPVWRIIESLDVFREVPQNPHFLPLAEIKEEFREGSAVGIMVTYSSLFEKISSLQFDDPKSIFDSILDSLEDLEKHGFDVALLRGRLNELSSIRGCHDELLEETKDAKRKMAGSMDEKAKCSEEVDEIKKKIAELQEQLAVVKSKEESIDLDIASFRRCVDAAQERHESARSEFKVVASAPWKLP